MNRYTYLLNQEKYEFKPKSPKDMDHFELLQWNRDAMTEEQYQDHIHHCEKCEKRNH